VREGCSGGDSFFSKSGKIGWPFWVKTTTTT